MENATKALLIAAAVLIAILIISLGIVVYTKASETIDSVNFSGQEITAFNDKFLQYEGKNVRGSEINAMLKTVLNSNMQSKSEGLTVVVGQKYVTVNVANGTNTAGTATAITLQASATSLGGVQANPSALYNVEIQYDGTTGFVSNIKVDTVTTTP